MNSNGQKPPSHDRSAVPGCEQPPGPLRGLFDPVLSRELLLQVEAALFQLGLIASRFFGDILPPNTRSDMQGATKDSCAVISLNTYNSRPAIYSAHMLRGFHSGHRQRVSILFLRQRSGGGEQLPTHRSPRWRSIWVVPIGLFTLVVSMPIAPSENNRLKNGDGICGNTCAVIAAHTPA